MNMWIANGAQRAWLIELEVPKVTIFRAAQELEVNNEPTSVYGSGPVEGQRKLADTAWIPIGMMVELKVPELQLPFRYRPQVPMTEHDFLRVNDFTRIEREPNGEILVMSPANSRTSNINSRICRFLVEWAEQDGRGLSFDSSGGFTLPDCSMRSPDAAWVLRKRWDALTQAQQSSFAPSARIS